MTQQTADALFLAGTQKHFPGNTPVTFGGGQHLPAEVTTAMQTRIAAGNATNIARTAAHAAVKAERTTRAQTKALVNQFKAFVLATFGEDVTKLAEFGLSPRKPATTKPATKVAAAAKAKATRTARGTKGKKAKLATKGAAQPAAPATPAAPAVPAKA
jgi:hypothetical protein